MIPCIILVEQTTATFQIFGVLYWSLMLLVRAAQLHLNTIPIQRSLFPGVYHKIKKFECSRTSVGHGSYSDFLAQHSLRSSVFRWLPYSNFYQLYPA